MKIAVIQASSQKEKNTLIYNCVLKAVKDQNFEVINFGIFPEEDVTYSYIEISLMISLLLESGAVDFVVTGCSSGQGMMLACNSLPGILCGYIPTPADAFLFGRINDGNAVSLPLGLNFGWSGEINLQSTLDKFFEGPFGSGYPKKDAERKKADTKKLKEMNAAVKRKIPEVLSKLDSELVSAVLQRRNVYEYILKYGTNKEVIDLLIKGC